MKLGRLQEVNITELWQHNPSGFATWFADQENIDVLNEETGLNLTQVTLTQAHDGNQGDLLALDQTSQQVVLIQNQFNQASVDFLGKLILNASQVNAGILIWIVKNADSYHRQAIQWLNQATTTGTKFFLIGLKAFRIGDSLPAPVFEIIETPETKPSVKPQVTAQVQATAQPVTPLTAAPKTLAPTSAPQVLVTAPPQAEVTPPPTPAPVVTEKPVTATPSPVPTAAPEAPSAELDLRSQRYLNFWTQFNEVVMQKGQPFNIRKAKSHHWYNIALGTSKAHVGITLSIEQNQVGIEIYIGDSKDLFDKLFDQKEMIELLLGFPMEWQRNDNAKVSRIIYYIDGLNIEQTEAYAQLMNEIVDKTVIIRDVFRKFI